jgi:hypothetical protein
MEVDPLQIFSIKTEPEDCEDSNVGPTSSYSISSQHCAANTSLCHTITLCCKSEPGDNDATPELPLVSNRINLLPHCKSENGDADEFNPCITRSSPELQYLNYPDTIAVLPRLFKIESTNQQNDYKSEAESPCKTPTLPSICLDTITKLEQICKINPPNDINSTNIETLPRDLQNYSAGFNSLAPTSALLSLNPSNVPPLNHIANTQNFSITELQFKRESDFSEKTSGSLLSPNTKRLHLKSPTSQIPLMSSTGNVTCDHNSLTVRSHHTDANMSHTTDVLLETASKKQANLESIKEVVCTYVLFFK